MTELVWMKTYVGTETALTGHLTAEEFGAYERLRRHYWQHRSIPGDNARLSRVTGVDPDRWPSVWEMIGPLFGEGGQLERIDRERSEAAAKRERKVLAGQKGAQKRWGGQPLNSNTNSSANGNGSGSADGRGNGTTMTGAMSKPVPNYWPSASASDEVRYEEGLAPARTREAKPSIADEDISFMRQDDEYVDQEEYEALCSKRELTNNYAAASKGK